MNYALVENVYFRAANATPWGIGLDIGNTPTGNRGNVTLIGCLFNRCTNAVRIAYNAGSELVNNVQMFGTKMVMNGSGSAIAGTTGVWCYTQLKGLQLYGCQFEGYDNGVVLDGCSDVEIRGCSFVNITGATDNRGIYMNGACEYVTIDTNRFGTVVNAIVLEDADHNAIQIFAQEFTSVTAKVTDGRTSGNIDRNHSFSWADDIRYRNLVLADENSQAALTLQGTTASSENSPNLVFRDNQATPQRVILRKVGNSLYVVDQSDVVQMRINLANGSIDLPTQGSDPASLPASGYFRLYFHTGSSTLRYINSAGTVKTVTAV
jgi:hypothetical protein